VIADEEYQEQARRVTAELYSEGLLPASRLAGTDMSVDPTQHKPNPWLEPGAPQFGPSPYMAPLAHFPDQDGQSARPAETDDGAAPDQPVEDAPAEEIEERFGHLEL
jgi:hypothetical protein